jgi:hypothetical protein
MTEKSSGRWMVQFGFTQKAKRRKWHIWLCSAGHHNGEAYPRAPLFELKPILGERKEHIRDANLIAAAPCLLTALEATLERYVQLAASGDCGNWNPEQETHVIASRAVIAKAKGTA